RDREDSYQGEGSSGTRYSPGPLRIALRGQIGPMLSRRRVAARGAEYKACEAGPRGLPAAWRGADPATAGRACELPQPPATAIPRDFEGDLERPAVGQR
ncbi:MAG: hypothetical protein ACYDCB_12200, partial [Candidatus Dormibacteria bacterium]